MTLPVPAGATLGVEEEFHVVDPVSHALRPSAALAEGALRRTLGTHLYPEISTTQLETTTGVCRTLADVRAEIRAARRDAVAAAAGEGLALLAASTHPFGTWQEQEVTKAPRYQEMVRRWAALALQQDICGCHVHVGVPEVGTAVAVMDRARPYLAVLLAMTGSSPFHDGVDTGYESFRTLVWGRWPTAGPPEHLGTAERYGEVVEGLVAAGVIADASHLYWDVRPSSHLPTVEFRLADVCTDMDDVVLHAALVRSLVRVLTGRAEREEQPPRPRAELLRAARWRAARDGLGGGLFDPVTGYLVEAREAVHRLLGELEDDLRGADEWDEVAALVDQLLARGTSAARQRSTWLRTGDHAQVAAGLLLRDA